MDTFLMLDQSHLACELGSAVTFNDLFLQMYLQRLPRVESLGAIRALKRLFFVGRHVRLQGFWVFEILAANATLELHILC